MQSYLIQISCLLQIIFIPFIGAGTEKYEKKRGLEQDFIAKFGYAGNDMILRNKLRDLNADHRGWLCSHLSDREYTTADFPVIKTWYIIFRSNQSSILAEVLSCSNVVSLFQGVDDVGLCYVLKKKRIKKYLQVLPPSKSDPFRISETYNYKVDVLNATTWKLPPPVVQKNQPGSHEPGYGSGSGSSSRRISREPSLAHPTPSAPPLESRWPSLVASRRSRSRNNSGENFRYLR